MPVLLESQVRQAPQAQPVRLGLLVLLDLLDLPDLQVQLVLELPALQDLLGQ